MKVNKLSHIFILVYVIFAFAAFCVTSLIALPAITNDAAEKEVDRLYREATSLASSYGSRYYSNGITTNNLETYITPYAEYLNADIWILSLEGTVDCAVTTSDMTPPTNFRHFDPSNVFTSGHSAIGNFYSYYSEDYISVYAPIVVTYSNEGYVIINEPASVITELVKESNKICYEILFYCLLLCLIIIFVIYYFTVYRIHSINSSMEEYLNGNYKPTVPVSFNDEITYLSKGINFMANKLDVQEDEQRKFISNVSHDFRSPLTSIKGYLVAILDGTIPPKSTNKYLKIILEEADRLHTLTNNLLDLNRIGSREFKLELVDFDINDIIVSSASSIEGQALQKNVSINLILCGDTMIVHADLSKIQQVLYNLLDNAVKFSKDNTTITLETTRKGDKLLISVKDQGIGINKESLDNVFNRFYKSDLSRGKDKKGTGLGLSIVKEIISAHDELIEVKSTVNVGTEFIFTLSISENEL